MSVWHRHKWSKWELGRGTHTTGQEVVLQWRECTSCGLLQRKSL